MTRRNLSTDDLPLVYSCSGCSSAAQMANDIALLMDRRGIAEMSCIAGVGGNVAPLVRQAKSPRRIIAIDGCPLHCTKNCLARQGVRPTAHFTLSLLGVHKQFHGDPDPRETEVTLAKLILMLKGHVSGR